MRSERGSIDILLMSSILAGTLIGANVAASLVTVGDGVSTHLALYAAALLSGITLWRRLIKPTVRGLDILVKLDGRVDRIEQRQIRIEEHLGIHSDTPTTQERATWH